MLCVADDHPANPTTSLPEGADDSPSPGPDQSGFQSEGRGEGRLKKQMSRASSRQLLRVYFQIAKSVYSGFTASVGAVNMPAATVAFVPCSIKMNEPVSRLVV